MNAFKIILISTFIFIAGCDDNNSPPPQPQLVTTAPDGTKLWSVQVHGDTIYFSSKGTQYEHDDGYPNRSHEVQVPNQGDN